MPYSVGRPGGATGASDNRLLWKRPSVARDALGRADEATAARGHVPLCCLRGEKGSNGEGSRALPGDAYLVQQSWPTWPSSEMPHVSRGIHKMSTDPQMAPPRTQLSEGANRIPMIPGTVSIYAIPGGLVDDWIGDQNPRKPDYTGRQ